MCERAIWKSFRQRTEFKIQILEDCLTQIIADQRNKKGKQKEVVGEEVERASSSHAGKTQIYPMEDISGWNRESSDKLEVQKGRLLDYVSILEQSVEGRLTVQLEKERSLHLKLRLHKKAKIEEISSRQKSRCLWLKGNKNTKFFSRIANSQKRINCIDKLLTGDEVSENNNIKAEILRFYQALYIEEEQWRPEVRFNSLNSLSQAEKTWLERNFDERRDQSCKLLLCSRQKSGCRWLYNGFLPKRQIIDASLIANEMLHGRLKSGTPGIMCKLDVEKAFDKVESRPNYSISVSHLLYANDTLIFYGAEKLQVQYLNLVIMLFEIISGLHINMLESKIYPVNTAPNLNELADIMVCEIGSYPATYLGMPLRAKYKAKEARNKVIKQTRAPHGMGPWKHINNTKDDFFQEQGWEWYYVKFWKDRWLLNRPLKESHPKLLQIATYPDSTVARKRDGFSINPKTQDNLNWNGLSKGVYTVKGGYNRLNIPNALTDHCKLPHTVNQLFLHYLVAAGIWSMYLAVSGISWSTPSTLKEVVEIGAYKKWIHPSREFGK
ncbi:hypothetical protein H5410_057177 [Solanum commersonii]|uniref:Reverse transcriptase domain-containing protein n=1 Tax=Solanum commersonii TaxID=4109 RepID=A0A9J5WM81_SOLCO|nr:hypothetical protein H5410_057177 [Solanum commersonii]